MNGPNTAVARSIAEMLILWPHLDAALERDTGQPEGGRISGGRAELGLPVNADVMLALATLEREVPKMAAWAAGVVAEPVIERSIIGHLQQLPRLHERMLVTAAVDEAARLAAGVHAFTRGVKLAVGLRTPDVPLGQYCPLHDDPLRELVAPGSEGYLRYTRLDREGQPVAPIVEWVRDTAVICRQCRAAWAPTQYLMLGRLLREADTRRTAVNIDEGAA